MDAELERAAWEARKNSYSPYSGYRVGAAVRDEQGRIHAGTNVENVSYGLSLCAERSAVARMIAEGGKRIRAVAVATKDGGMPCGMCRQVLTEFAENAAEVPVVCLDEAGNRQAFSLGDLLPHSFDSEAVERTPSASEGSTST